MRLVNKEKYRGIIPPILTPLTKEETLDVPALKRIIDYCMEGGCSGVFVNGSCGEAMRVTDQVWEEAMNIALEYTGSRGIVFCGAIESSTSRQLEKIKKVEQAGGKIAVCTVPFYHKVFSQKEIIDHYLRLCEESNIEIAVYNIPDTTHTNILPETVAELAKQEKITVCKDSCADWCQVQKELSYLEKEDIAFFNGAEELCGVSMLFGASGCIPGLAQFIPGPFVDLCRLAENKELDELMRLQAKITEYRRVLGAGPGWLAVMKYLLELYGLGQAYPSWPIEGLSQEQKTAVKHICDSVIF